MSAGFCRQLGGEHKPSLEYRAREKAETSATSLVDDHSLSRQHSVSGVSLGNARGIAGSLWLGAPVYIDTARTSLVPSGLNPKLLSVPRV